ncbi:MAG TPA: response regulator [Microvirga sp.]|jgi:CheY-like chemotaxis protein|nr:response regulator [Microvirga sp.]
MRVLFVEDDDVSRVVVEATLRDCGIRVVSVSSAAEALDLLESGIEPDLLLTDIQLPGDCDGCMLAEIFQDELPDLPIIFITAKPQGVHQVNNSVYLLKPLKPALLLEAIGAIAPARAGRLPARLH